VARYLQERLGWEPDAAGKAAVRCGGSIGAALSLKEEESGEGGEEAALLLKEIRGFDGPQVLEVARAWAGDREKARVRLELLRIVVRDALLLTLGRKDVDRADLRDSLEPAARQWGVAPLLAAWEQVGEALRGMERNGNPQLIMEDLLLGFRESHASARGMGTPNRAMG
jgi:predicted flavoprotein YhiN